MSDRLHAKFGLPQEVRFCRTCVMSNQRPLSSDEYQHSESSVKDTLPIDQDGVCLACRNMDVVFEDIDWQERERELLVLLDQHRRDDGGYDVLVPGSGGKDGAMAAHLLKYKYGMNPLTVTWSPHLYTDIGWQNFQNWIHVGGFDNYLFTPNGRVHRLLTRQAVQNLLHPFQPFILGQKTFAPKMALKFGIKLVFYGEMPAQYGEKMSIKSRAFGESSDAPGFQLSYKDSAGGPYIGGVPVAELISKHGVSAADLAAYLPADPAQIAAAGIDFQYLGYYTKWIPQEAYYYAVEHTGFRANPERTEGTYSKYNSLDDKIDGFHYYTTFIKYGLGRASYDASQEIRNRHLTREEGVALVRRFDGEFPERYFAEILDYLDLDEGRFHALCDDFRSPHLWGKESGEWKLRHAVYQA